jgi:hypothetical protein
MKKEEKEKTEKVYGKHTWRQFHPILRIQLPLTYAFSPESGKSASPRRNGPWPEGLSKKIPYQSHSYIKESCNFPNR